MPLEIEINHDIQSFFDQVGITLEDFMHIVRMRSSEVQNKVPENTLLEVILHFEKHITNHPKKAETTKKYYISFLERLKEFVLTRDKDMKLVRLSEEFFYDFLAQCIPRNGKSLKDSSFNTYIAVLKAMLMFAYSNELTNKDYRYRFENVISGLMPRYLQDHEVSVVLKRALQKTHGYRCHAIISFLVGTGCRVDELVNVRVQDFDIENGLLYIRKGKGNKERYITIFPMILRITMDYLLMTGVKEWNRNITGHLFSRDFGMTREKPISVRSVQHMVHNIVKDLGLERKYTVHSFRHTFAVNCLKAGMSLTYLSQLLGHKSPATTAVYTQLLPIDLKNEVMKKYPFPFEQLLYPVVGVD